MDYRKDLPVRRIEPTPEGLLEAALPRLNRNSALWHQSGLHDVIVVEEDWDQAIYYEEMPMAEAQSGEIGDRSHYYTISLEPGKDAGTAESAFLHPVVRRWGGRRLLSELHLPEDLEGEWKRPEAHVAPLRYFFIAQLLESVAARA